MDTNFLKMNRAVAIGMLQDSITPNPGYIAKKYLEVLMLSETNQEKLAALKVAMECVNEQEN